MADLIADADGDLIGTTAFGGANGDGTVFEIAKTSSGYPSTPTTLVIFVPKPTAWRTPSEFFTKRWPISCRNCRS